MTLNPIPSLVSRAAHVRQSFRDVGPASVRFLTFIGFNVLSWQALVGGVLTLHARALGIDAGMVGILSSLLPFSMVAALLAKPMAERVGSKRLLTSGWTLRNLLIAPMILTPWVYARWGTHAAAMLILVSVSLFCLLRAVSGLGWGSWLHEIVADDRRGLYYSLEFGITRVVGVVFALFFFCFFGANPALWKFSVVSAVGVAAGLASIVFLRRVPGGLPPARTTASVAASYREMLHTVRDRDFSPFLAVASLGTFVNFGQMVLVMLFMRDHLHITPSVILLVTGMGNVAAAMTIQRWGRIADSHGSPVTMAASAALAGLALAVLATITPGPHALRWVLPAVVLLGIGVDGFVVSANRGFLHRINPAARHAYVAVWSAVTSVAGGLSSIAAGFFIRHGSFYWEIAAGYGAIMLAVSFCCVRLKESNIDFSKEEYDLFDPDRPVISLLRMWSYVLNPAQSGPAGRKQNGLH